MRTPFVSSLALLVLASSQLQGQVSLSSPISSTLRTKSAPLATVTVPAMSFRGDLAGVPISLGYEMAWIAQGGAGVELRALPGPGAAPSATTIWVSADGSLPAGSYSVRWEFVNVAFASQLAVRSGNGTTLATCSLTALPGYTNVQSCAVSLSIADGRLFVGITPTTFGAVMTLKQVTVARWP